MVRYESRACASREIPRAQSSGVIRQDSILSTPHQPSLTCLLSVTKNCRSRYTVSASAVHEMSARWKPQVAYSEKEKKSIYKSIYYVQSKVYNVLCPRAANIGDSTYDSKLVQARLGACLQSTAFRHKPEPFSVSPSSRPWHSHFEPAQPVATHL